MAKKFVIGSSYTSEEGEYVREACKLADPTLIDDDFDIVVGNGDSGAWVAAIDHYLDSGFRNQAVKPILVFSYAPGQYGLSRIPDCFDNYPNIPVVSAFYGQGALPSLPAGYTFHPDRIPNFIASSGGVSGLSDWYTGAALEFTEEAPLQFVNFADAKITFSISNVTNNSGVARIYNASLAAYATTGMLVTLAGIAGFQNSINGQRTIASVNSGGGYITINFDLGTGTFSGTATADIRWVSGAIGDNVTSFPIVKVENNSGVAKIYSASLAAYAVANELVHLTGIAGFQNDINGKRAVASVNSGGGYITINFDLGTGTFSGTATAKIHWVSGAIGAVAAKIHKIMRGRNCGFWEARYCARQTGSESGVHDNTKGYGYINVDDAIAYADEIPADEFDALGAIGTLALTIDSQDKAQFTHPEILNAREARLFANNELLKHFTGLQPGSTFSYTHYPIKLGDIDYKLVGYRDGQVTNPSNIVNTDIETLEDKPERAVFEKEDGTPYEITVYYLDGKTPKTSTIVSIEKTVSNPYNDNAGVQVNYYNLANGLRISEPHLFASLRDLLFNVSSPQYLSGINILRIDVYGFPGGDLCGQDFTGVDFTDDGGGDFDFTGAICRYTKFISATLPAAYLDEETGLDLFLSQVAYCDTATTYWVNGQSIKAILES